MNNNNYNALKLAAEQGNVDAQFNLGVMLYAASEGITQDYPESYVWFSLAAAKGHKIALKSRDGVAKYLTDRELQIAQQEAKKRFQEIESRQSE